MSARAETNDWDAIVVGGGFFGVMLATELGRRGARTLLLESGPALLGRASARNQARVHAGYHYPRSYLTGLRSRINAPRFIAEFRECIFDDFAHYYAIGRAFSNVTGAQFRRFCARIGASVAAPPKAVVRLFNPVFIEDVVLASEVTFDADRLRTRVTRDLAEAGVTVELDTSALRVARTRDARIAVTARGPAAETVVRARRVFNCTYSALNRLNEASGLPVVPLKHELTEMALVEPPAELTRTGITVMCGPFFSLLPYPPRGLCTLSHVRYTPHAVWHDQPESLRTDPDVRLATDRRVSAYPHMIRDAARYLPAIAGCRQVDSLWEVKTVLPRSEADDSRPILFSRNHGMIGYHCVTGSKVDNAYDMLDVVLDAPDSAAEAS
jgi:glycine/D-amino acid oxidase-like deaminating enzyme